MSAAPDIRRATEGAEIISVSSATYAFNKYGPPVVFAMFFSFVVISEGPRVLWFGLPCFGILIGLYAYNAQFKHVALRGPCLVVWDDRQTAHIPLGQISRVSQSLARNPVVVTVELHGTSPFGRKILFVPSIRPPFSYRDSPVVKQLLEESRLHMNEPCCHEGAV